MPRPAGNTRLKAARQHAGCEIQRPNLKTVEFRRNLGEFGEQELTLLFRQLGPPSSHRVSCRLDLDDRGARGPDPEGCARIAHGNQGGTLDKAA